MIEYPERNFDFVLTHPFSVLDEKSIMKGNIDKDKNIEKVQMWRNVLKESYKMIKNNEEYLEIFENLNGLSELRVEHPNLYTDLHNTGVDGVAFYGMIADMFTIFKKGWEEFKKNKKK